MEKRVKVILSLACIGIFMLTTATMSRAQNLLVDPGAEGQVVSGSGNGEGGWTLFNGAAFSTDFAHSGSWSIKDAGPGGFTVPGDFQTFNGVTTFWSGLDGTGSNLGTVETSPGNALFSAHLDGLTPLNTWVPLSVTAHAPAGAMSVQCFSITIDQTPVSAYFDDMTLIPEPSTIALALTGLFGLVAFGWKKRSV